MFNFWAIDFQSVTIEASDGRTVRYCVVPLLVAGVSRGWFVRIINHRFVLFNQASSLAESYVADLLRSAEQVADCYPYGIIDCSSVVSRYASHTDRCGRLALVHSYLSLSPSTWTGTLCLKPKIAKLDT